MRYQNLAQEISNGMNQSQSPERSEKDFDKRDTPQIESREQAPEKSEDKFEDMVTGAEILEDPKDGSFSHAMQVFIAWVNDLLAKK